MAASTNFQQWNPQQINQENDAAYTADGARTGGAGTGSPFLSETANKLFYQASTFYTAFANALVAKGYSPNDASLTALEAVFANVLTEADTKSSLVVVSYSATPVFNALTSSGFEMVLNGNVTGATITNPQVGQLITLILVQDSNGGHTFTGPTGQPIPPIDTTPGAVNVIQFIVRSDKSLHIATPISVS